MTSVYLTRGELVHGVSDRSLQRRAASGRLERVHRGYYVGPSGSTVPADGNAPSSRVQLEKETADDRAWRTRLFAHLARGGPSSAISHRAAARIHRLEGLPDRTEDITVPMHCGWKTSPAIRSSTLTADDIIDSGDGLRVTTVHRTLLDLGRFADPDTLELAVEHALRGSDNRRPDVWNEGLLAQLQTTVAERRVPASLRIVLMRRGVQRPTGSYAETVMGQGLRVVGVAGLVRQATITVIGAPGVARTLMYFPDFVDLERGLLIEVDGRLGHEGDANIDRDDRRQNLLSSGFRVVRFHARTVFEDPVGVARAIEHVRQTLPIRPVLWTGPGASVLREAESAVLTLN